MLLSSSPMLTPPSVLSSPSKLTVRHSSLITLSLDANDEDERLAAEATAAALAAAEFAEAAAKAASASAPTFDIRSLAGISAPLGFWDPAGFSEGKTEGTLRFYREVEIKHGRVSMLAALGFPVAEHFHPLFGGYIDVPSYVAFQQTPLQSFWPLVLAAISIFELSSVFAFDRPYDLFYSVSLQRRSTAVSPNAVWCSLCHRAQEGGGFWSIRSEHPPGDLGFDPLSLKPSDKEEMLQMQTKELNHGRLAMLGIAGMVAQELATGEKLWV